jgi:small conductance mechanosensitive channel
MNSVGWSIIQDKLHNWWLYALNMLPNLILALAVLLIFYVTARIVRKVSGGFILRVSKSPSVSGLLSGILYTLVLIAGFMTALDLMELDKTVSSLIAGVGIIGLALGFAFQDLTSNFISGAFIALKRPFDVGHIVETNGFQGTIEDIRLRSTTLRTSTGLHVIIPNKDIFQKPIINYSRTEVRRVEFDFVVPHSTDAIYVEKTILNALSSAAERNESRGINIFYTAIENPNMRINVSFWTTRTEPQDFMRAKHRAILQVYQAFTRAGIYKVTIPEKEFPEG